MNAVDTNILIYAVDHHEMLYSEDMDAGMRYGSVTVVNPFS